MSKYGYTVKHMGIWYQPGEDVPDDVPTEAMPHVQTYQMNEEEAAIADIIEKPIVKKKVVSEPTAPKKAKGRPKKA